MKSISARIKNDKFGVLLFLLIYILISLFFYSVYYINDLDFSSYLVFHKMLFYVNTFFTVISHLRCFLTNPGIIEHEYNPHKIEFYLNIREEGINRASVLSEKIGKKAFEHVPDGLDSDNEFTDYDDHEYPAVTSIQDNLIESIKRKHKINFKRCDRCYVVRFPGVKHCSKCQGCIMSMDHHCPWVFNCIGQFNQKFFIQFLMYSFFGIFEASIIIGYYAGYKNQE